MMYFNVRFGFSILCLRHKKMGFQIKLSYSNLDKKGGNMGSLRKKVLGIRGEPFLTGQC